jgi:hypothetical protein
VQAFNISSEEWQYAMEQLSKAPSGTKLRRNKCFQNTHSFIVLNNVLYAISNKYEMVTF